MKNKKGKSFRGLKGQGVEISLGDLVDRLGIVNQKIWALENEIRKGGEGKFTLAEIGRRALLVRDFNKERIAYKNAINKIGERYFNDIKIDHRSAFEENNNE